MGGRSSRRDTPWPTSHDATRRELQLRVLVARRATSRAGDDRPETRPWAASLRLQAHKRDMLRNAKFGERRSTDAVSA